MHRSACKSVLHNSKVSKNSIQQPSSKSPCDLEAFQDCTGLKFKPLYLLTLLQTATIEHLTTMDIMQRSYTRKS